MFGEGNTLYRPFSAKYNNALLKSIYYYICFDENVFFHIAISPGLCE